MCVVWAITAEISKIDTRSEASIIEDEQSIIDQNIQEIPQFINFAFGHDSINSDIDESLQLASDKVAFIDNLKKWIVSSNCTITDAQSLLKILKPHHPELPLCHKTLLKTSHLEKYQVVTIGDKDKFVYFGIKRQITRIINLDLHQDESKIEVQYNMDNLPVFYSSKIEFWPIVGRIVHNSIRYKPFPIAFYLGKGKPSNLTIFFNGFIKELNDLNNNGININGKIFNVKILGFINDIPARAFIKCTKGHSGYYGCERCQIKGIYFKKRLIFPFLLYPKRTDESFRLQDQPQHHNGQSTLLNCEKIDLIRDFILDSMHLVYLGVTKKLLNTYWIPPSRNKISKENLTLLSLIFENVSSQIPCEFRRTTRTLEELALWKALDSSFYMQEFIFWRIFYRFYCISIFHYYMLR